MRLSQRDKKFIGKISQQNVTFDDFKKLASDNSLNFYERIGFPEAYRKDFDEIILDDIKSKLPEINNQSTKILDIGCGCSPLTEKIIDNAIKYSQELYLCDCKEMLDLLKSKTEKHTKIKTIVGQFPENFKSFTKLENNLDAIILYSVIQVVFNENDIYNFIDSALELLKDGGKLLIGDIPNISKRNRFFASPNGIKYHQAFTKSQEEPKLTTFKINKNKIDDGIIFSILQRYRNFGFETYLLPQDPKLAMANRREDILIVKN